jgi:hypothetical protein
MKRLNQSGFVHWSTTLLPVLVIAAVAVIGVKVLTASHALTPAVNGNLYTSSESLYTQALVYLKQLNPGSGTTANCRYWAGSFAGVSIDGKKIANTCQTTATQTFEIDTYNTADGLGFKKLALVPNTVNSKQLKWQKTKVGTTNVQILDLERLKTSPSYSMFALYDSVTGARKTVTMNGTDNILPNDKGSINDYDWSADGKKILYLADDEITGAAAQTVKLTLCSIDISLAVPTNACGTPVSVPGLRLRGAAWNRDSNKLAIITINSDQSTTATTTLYTANADLSGLKKLTTSPAGQTMQSPVWSPDGLLLAVANYQYSVTPTKQTQQIRSASTGAIVRQKSEGPLVAVKAWLPK